MSTDPYEELAELAEAGLALAEQDRLDELADLFDRSSAIAAELPDEPPPSARPALERAAAAQDRLRARIGASLAGTRSELDQADRGRRAARSYGATAPALVDRSA